MKNILVFGAGKSAGALISYLSAKAENEVIKLTVADASAELLAEKTTGFSRCRTVVIDIKNETVRFELITAADIVISLMPPALHMLIAKDCLRAKKHLLTASYADDAMKALSAEVATNDLLFLCECGLDPGIDHMSAMRLIDQIKSEGGTITSFKSHCGGLIAPESDTNDWHYKISWNPRNVVLAGQAGARYRSNGEICTEPYPALFDPQRQRFSHAALQSFAYYPNRDSLPYIDIYDLHEVQEFVRTTIRHSDFIAGWRVLAEAIDISDDKSIITPTGLSDFFAPVKAILPATQFDQIGGNDSAPVPVPHPASSADYLQHALEKHWHLSPSDRDLVIMYHEIGFVKNGTDHKAESLLVIKGMDERHTAMSMTVGLPLGICAMMLAENKIKLRGVQIPIQAELYTPVLAALKNEGIDFIETMD